MTRIHIFQLIVRNHVILRPTFYNLRFKCSHMGGRRPDFELVLDKPKLTTVLLPQALRMKEKYV